MLRAFLQPCHSLNGLSSCAAVKSPVWGQNDGRIAIHFLVTVTVFFSEVRYLKILLKILKFLTHGNAVLCS